MRAQLVALSLLTLAGSALAQVNAFHVYTGRTSFTSRGFLGGNAGETLQGYPTEHYRGVGDDGTFGGPKSCVVHGLTTVTQDQDSSTVEQFWVVFRSATATGEPDGSAAGLIAEAGPFDLPTTGNPSPAAFSVTIDLNASPVQVPCKDVGFYAGLRLSANPSWTADGQSTHASAYTDPASPNGDPVISGAPSWAYQVDSAGAVRATNPRSWNYALLTERAVFQIGCVQSTDGLFGSCGNYPDVTTHGLAFRVRDAKNPNAPYSVLVSDSLTGGPPIPVDGHLWLNLGTLITVASGMLDGDGEAEFTPSGFAPGDLVGLAGSGVLPFQATVLDFGTGLLPFRMTNAQATRL